MDNSRKRYWCGRLKCTAGFTREQDLIRHLDLQHELTHEYVCERCASVGKRKKFKFKRGEQLRGHLARMHEESYPLDSLECFRRPIAPTLVDAGGREVDTLKQSAQSEPDSIQTRSEILQHSPERQEAYHLANSSDSKDSCDFDSGDDSEVIETQTSMTAVSFWSELKKIVAAYQTPNRGRRLISQHCDEYGTNDFQSNEEQYRSAEDFLCSIGTQTFDRDPIRGISPVSLPSSTGMSISEGEFGRLVASMSVLYVSPAINRYLEQSAAEDACRFYTMGLARG